MSKFYQLGLDQFLNMNEVLKDAELRVCLYLMASDPFGDRKVEIETAVIAEHLGLTRRTIQRSLNRLDELGFIEWKVTKQSILGKWRQSDRQATNGSPELELMATHGSPKRHTDRQSDTRIAKATDGSPTSSKKHTEQSFQNPHTIHTNNTNQIRSEIENFDLKDQEINHENQEEVKAIAVDPEKEFKDFIIKTIERDRNIKIANRQAYLSKVLAKDREQWRSLYEERNRPKAKARDVITEDIWRLEQSLSNAIKMRDYEFAIARLENIPDMAEQIYQKHPEWRSLLCG